MPQDLDPEGKRLPIRIDSTSNGEFLPLELTSAQKLTNQIAHETADENSRRLGIGRRAFLASSAGAAATLAACNTANPGAGGRTGVQQASMLPNKRLSPFFLATVQATEEAIVNALIAAETMSGINGNTKHAIPHDRLQQAMKKYNR